MFAQNENKHEKIPLAQICHKICVNVSKENEMTNSMESA